ncbi:MAG: hypothetical protein ACJA0I_000815 [Gammaproteobacteria bacterium]|jgi:hypothetical protein
MGTFKSPQYTYLKDGSYYFSRAVPLDLRYLYSKPRIIQALRTKSQAHAKMASRSLASTISGDGQRHILSIADIERLPLHTTNFAFGDINGLRGDFVGVKLIDLLNYVGITKFNQSWL